MMPGIRGGHRSFIAAVLAVHFSAVTSISAVVCLTVPEAATAVTCTCAHHDDKPCPMHHPDAPKSSCSCRGTTDPATAVLAALLGPNAVLPPAADDLTRPGIADHVSFLDVTTLDAPHPPDGPPPRA